MGKKPGTICQNEMTNSWAFLYDELYPDGEMKESKPFQSNQFEVEKQRAMSNIEDVTNSQEDWEDFWYNSESEGKDMPEEKVEEDTTPKTFSYDGWIPKKVFGIQSKQFYERDGKPFLG